MEKMRKRSLVVFLGILVALLFLQTSCATGTKTSNEKELSTLSAQAAGSVETPAKAQEKQETPAVTKEIAETPAKVEENAQAGLFLADKHKAQGLECSNCHKENPPANDVPKEQCLSCHEDYNQVAASYIDPHNAHVTYTNCSDCHHGHRESENQCQGCHSFNLKTP
jgi:hypothetical protein